MLALAQSELGIAAAISAFDRDPYQLNTHSGTVNLRTMELAPHDPGTLITKLAPVFFDPAAHCPRWLNLLDRIMGGDCDRIDFLQRAFGYSLTGDSSEQVIFILHGSGANGKSTLLETMRAVIGDYSMNAPAEALMVKQAGAVSNDIARLRGARFVTAVETGSEGRLAEPLIKQMSGTDTITARFLYKEPIEFRPTFKLWLATNHRPTITGSDYAIWRRIRLLPFDVTIPPGDRDKQLPQKLLSESRGILAWALRGCQAWLSKGLGECGAVQAATEVYRTEMDPLTDFLADRCVLGAGLRAHGLYGEYERWCRDSGMRDALSAVAFKRLLESRGYRSSRDWQGRYFEGLGLAVAGDR
jgi:putative DNA primase/helicase